MVALTTQRCSPEDLQSDLLWILLSVILGASSKKKEWAQDNAVASSLFILSTFDVDEPEPEVKLPSIRQAQNYFGFDTIALKIVEACQSFLPGTMDLILLFHGDDYHEVYKSFSRHRVYANIAGAHWRKAKENSEPHDQIARGSDIAFVSVALLQK